MRDFETIYHRYGGSVYAYLLSLSGDAALAEELTQETMLRAILNIGTFRGESKLSVWLCQIAKNLYLDWRKKSRRTVSLEAQGEPCGRGDPAMEIEERDMADRILRHLHKLEEPYKEVFTLHALGDVPLKRISQLFGKSDSWARVTYDRAKAMITEKLEEGES